MMLVPESLDESLHFKRGIEPLDAMDLRDPEEKIRREIIELVKRGSELIPSDKKFLITSKSSKDDIKRFRKICSALDCKEYGELLLNCLKVGFVACIFVKISEYWGTTIYFRKVDDGLDHTYTIQDLQVLEYDLLDEYNKRKRC